MLQTSIGKQLYTEFQKVLWHLPAEQPPTASQVATPDNLARWGRIVDPRCKLCTRSPCTLGHLLSNCKVALDQGRFTYRHNQILHYLLKTLAAPGLEGLTFHSDLEGWKVGGGSIPPEIVVTS